MKDLYSILGIERGASDRDIKTAYRKRARECHPDHNKGREAEAAEEFKDVNSAYDILGDEDKRRAYDESGDAGAAEQSLTRIEVMLKATISALLARAEPGVNLLDALRGTLIGAMERKRDETKELRAEVERLTTFLDKQKRTKPGPNIFNLAIEEALHNKDLRLLACQADLADARDMHAYLAEYQNAALTLVDAFRERWAGHTFAIEGGG